VARASLPACLAACLLQLTHSLADSLTVCCVLCMCVQDPEGAGRGVSRLPVLTLTHSRRSQMLVDPPCNCSAGPASEDYSTWHATILGSAHTPAPAPAAAAAAAAAVVVSRRAQARWLAVRGRRVLPQDRVPDRLPVPAAQGKALACSLACSLQLDFACGIR
jgi:hypothetical protein